MLIFSVNWVLSWNHWVLWHSLLVFLSQHSITQFWATTLATYFHIFFWNCVRLFSSKNWGHGINLNKCTKIIYDFQKKRVSESTTNSNTMKEKTNFIKLFVENPRWQNEFALKNERELSCLWTICWCSTNVATKVEKCCPSMLKILSTSKQQLQFCDIIERESAK